MKSTFSRYIIILIVLFLSNFNIDSQTFKINKLKSTIFINGNTNLHSFTSKVTEINGELVINNSNKVNILEVKIPVESIKSGEKLMDKKTYETFNYEKYPSIIFKLHNSTIKSSNENIMDVDLIGNLTMAGVKKTIRFKSAGKQMGAGIYHFVGNIHLKLSDFKMIPPTFMLGVMRVYDDIVLKYDMVLEENSIK